MGASKSAPAPTAPRGFHGEMPDPRATRDARRSGSEPPAHVHGGRYVQEAVLGHGGMGTVYLVRDRETGEQLALKRLLHMDGRSILRLKREFRSLADVSHPNLIKVYELGQEREGWFLTMEYLAGVELTSYLGLDDGRDDTEVRLTGVDSAFPRTQQGRAARVERVLACFGQLAQGIAGLHSVGMLHRDLKPSNVMVAGDRIVVLDFGLVQALDPNAPALTEEGAHPGTPAYMSPEQACGEPLSEASDWYAFGVMLYEALTRELPFDGAVLQLLSAKVERDPPAPRELDPQIPVALDALCMQLLSRDPAARPKGSEVLRRLGVSPEPASSPGLASLRPHAMHLASSPAESDDTDPQSKALSLTARPAFFGREAEVATLWQAMAQAEAGRGTVVHVRGVSGAGKTALIERFLDEVEQPRGPAGHADAVVLRSRCYEREDMPFKALDSVVDSLSRHLATLHDLEVSNLLPTDIGVLTQLFPVLERLPAARQLLAGRSRRGASAHQRQRAETALREVITRLTARSPVVVWIDDLHWGDLDSAHILEGWLQHARELPLLLVFSYRSDEVETSECLRLLLRDDDIAVPGTVHRIAVDALDDGDLERLCRERLGADASEHAGLIAHIVEESEGSPFLAAQLTALAQAKLAQGDTDVRQIGIHDMVAQSTAILPKPARRLLGVLAVAGRPMVPKLALRAARIDGGGGEALHDLRRLQLVRTREVAAERLLEIYHDRVREGVCETLSDAQSALIHGRLLQALEDANGADPDWLHALALGAGQRDAAYRHGLAAAERANSALAFERAAELYARCLQLRRDGSDDGARLHTRLGFALGHCGRGSEAADAYLRAAELSKGPEAAKLMRLATSHLLRSGRFDEGEALVSKVLDAVDIRVPASRGRMAAAILWRRLGRRFRKPSFVERRAEDVPKALLERLDTLACLRVETMSINPLRGAYFLEQQLRLALQVGEPARIVHALCGVAYSAATSGSDEAAGRVDGLLAEARELADRADSPDAIAEVRLVEAVAHWMLGRSERVLEPAAEAVRIYCTIDDDLGDASYYERLIALSARVGALYEIGDLAAFASELQSALGEARATGNRAAQLLLSANETILDEMMGRSEEAVARLMVQREQLPQPGFGNYHALHLVSLCRMARHFPDPDWVLQAIEEDWVRFLQSPLRRTAYVAAIVAMGRVNAIAPVALAQPDPVAALTRLAREVESLTRGRPVHMARPLQHALRARLALAKGDRAGAMTELEATITSTRSPVRRPYYEMALGTLLGTDEGIRMREQAERSLRERGVKAPLDVACGLLPEIFEG